MEYQFDTIEAPWTEIHAALRDDVHPAEEMAGEVPGGLEGPGNAIGAAGPARWQVLAQEDPDWWGWPDRETLGDA